MKYHPLTQYNLLENGDIARIIDVGGQIFWENRCRSLSDDHKVGAEFNGLNLGPMSLAYLSFSKEVTIEPEFNDSFILVQTTLDGCSATWNGNSCVETGTNDTLVVDPLLPTTVSLRPGCAHFVLKLERRLVEEKLRTVSGCDPGGRLRFEFALSDESARRSWIETMRFLCRFYGMPNPLFDRDAVIHRGHAEMVAYTLLRCQRHNYSDILDAGAGRVATPRCVRIATEYIEENIKTNISLSEISQQAGVTERTLQNGFKRHLGMSPSEFIRSRRLHHIHRELADAGKRSNVSQIMWRYGISNPGLWAKYYQQKYGCYPAQTLKSKPAW